MRGEKQREREQRSNLAQEKQRRKEELANQGLKQCTKCEIPKPLDEFYPSTTHKDGRRSHCIPCVSIYTKSPSGKEASQRSCRKKRENPDYVARELAYGAEWRKNNPEKHRASEQKRRARKLATDAEDVDNLIVFERDGWICQLCKAEVFKNLKWPDPESASLDHVIPLSKGGSHSYDNTQLAHLRCNISKGAKLEEGVSPIARPCLTCEDERRDDIEMALKAGDRPVVVAANFPPLTEGAIRRHSQHMDRDTGTIVVRKNAETALQQAMSSAGLIAELSSLYATAEAVGKYAMNRGNEQTTLKALQTQLSVIDSVRKLSESERGADEAAANAGAADDLRCLTLALRAVLPKFPAAGEALADKLEELGEWQAASAIRQLSKVSV